MHVYLSKLLSIKKTNSRHLGACFICEGVLFFIPARLVVFSRNCIRIRYNIRFRIFAIIIYKQLTDLLLTLVLFFRVLRLTIQWHVARINDTDATLSVRVHGKSFPPAGVGSGREQFQVRKATSVDVTIVQTHKWKKEQGVGMDFMAPDRFVMVYEISIGY